MLLPGCVLAANDYAEFLPWVSLLGYLTELPLGDAAILASYPHGYLFAGQAEAFASGFSGMRDGVD